MILLDLCSLEFVLKVFAEVAAISKPADYHGKQSMRDQMLQTSHPTPAVVVAF
ncbi:hypothetical protein SCP_1001230 [Sparassis crispa]|uniref:Uncharacterized protein n=1 Tax=Sparassis crispa TaxID=139825 RepID=A0A401GXH3_9APHY|nr:hypothetical protein SCP_1001230 [Sparassis crispa]GBE86880.1 hypothetical protein SCP_1001230 [Sparassis crispa]